MESRIRFASAVYLLMMLIASTASRAGELDRNLLGTAEPHEMFGKAIAVGDFNGDGFGDVASGFDELEPAGGRFTLWEDPYLEWGWDLLGQTHVGGVHVVYGAENGLGSKESNWPGTLRTFYDFHKSLFVRGFVGEVLLGWLGDDYGSALAAGDFNHDGYDDLAIGAPGVWEGGAIEAGAIYVVPGSSSGLQKTSARKLTQRSSGVPGGAEAYDHFGSVLAAGDFDCDRYDDLAIGVPDESVSTLSYAGYVVLLPGSAKGLAVARPGRGFTQETVGGERVEAGDRFGAALSVGNFDNDYVSVPCEDLAIGVDSESIEGAATKARAGRVQVLYASRTLLDAAFLGPFRNNVWDRDKLGLGAATNHYWGAFLTTGDFDRDGSADLVIGRRAPSPGCQRFASLYQQSLDPYCLDTHRPETSFVDAVIYGSRSGLVASGAHAIGIAGMAAAAGDFDGDDRADLAIGRPWDTVNGQAKAGRITILRSQGSGLAAATAVALDQGSYGAPGVVEPGDRFGQVLAVGNLDGWDKETSTWRKRDDLLVGVPGENGSAGAVDVLFGSANGLPDLRSIELHQ